MDLRSRREGREDGHRDPIYARHLMVYTQLPGDRLALFAGGRDRKTCPWCKRATGVGSFEAGERTKEDLHPWHDEYAY